MELPIRLQKENGIPLYIQLQEQLRLLLKRGELQPGNLMPTAREMALALGISSNTVVRVYRELERDGWLVLRRGIGTFVSDAMPTNPLGKRDVRGLEQRVRELIVQARQSGITCVEIFQLLETRWMERSDQS